MQFQCGVHAGSNDRKDIRSFSVIIQFVPVRIKSNHLYGLRQYDTRVGMHVMKDCQKRSCILRIVDLFIVDPAGIWCQNEVVSTSMRRDHVASTLTRRHFYVMCPLGNILISHYCCNLTVVVSQFHDTKIFCARYPVTFHVYTAYHDTSEIKHGSTACTVNNPLA